MDFGFFGQTGETAIQNQQLGSQHFQSQDNAPDDQFQFAEPNKYVSMETVQQSSYVNYEPDNQSIRRIQEEQARIQQRLRQKANQEYEQKQKRKQQGRKQYQEFTAKKQKQLQVRKQQNKEKQKQLININLKLSQQAGWKKVALNVPLKQGEHKGKKDITRMRQSIINKRNDQAK